MNIYDPGCQTCRYLYSLSSETLHIVLWSEQSFTGMNVIETLQDTIWSPSISNLHRVIPLQKKNHHPASQICSTSLLFTLHARSPISQQSYFIIQPITVSPTHMVEIHELFEAILHVHQPDH